MVAMNAKVARLLRDYAAALRLNGADRFKVKAYQRVADMLDVADVDVAALVARGDDLRQLPGIGAAISEKIIDIVRTGKLKQLDKAMDQLPPELAELAALPRLDPKRVSRVYKKLGIHSVAELRSQLARGQILAAFDPRMEFHIRQGLDERPRMLLPIAEELADGIEEFLRSSAGVTRMARAGSVRRKQDTVGDLNFLASAKSAAVLFKQFSRFGGALSSEKVSSHQRNYKLSSGRNIGIVHSSTADWGANLILATGSAAHLDALGKHAGTNDMGLSAAALAAKGVDCSEESAVYQALGLCYIEPELREGRGEIAAAVRGSLPKLVELSDIRGDLHMHTTASDGASTLAEMAEAAKSRGYEYIAITDHSQSLKITNGLTEKRLFEQIAAIDKLNRRLSGITVLKSAEVDILADGTLDYSDAALKELDLTVCSIHSRFALDREQQTARILRAMDHRYFSILGHATGRLLLQRQGYEVDIERILEHAKARGCYFEINSSPNRLDLSDEHVKLAKEAGIKIAINTDAHSIDELDFMQWGLNQAHRGWLERGDVLNAQAFEKT